MANTVDVPDPPTSKIFVKKNHQRKHPMYCSKTIQTHKFINRN